MASNIARVGLKRNMRIYALPLTSTRTSASAGHKEHLTYYHFVTPPPPEGTGTNWVQWATNKASGLWADFGKAPEGHWKRRVFTYGERLVDRIDFEELALKSVDPSLGPKLTRFGRKEKEPKESGTPTIPLIYPGSACSSPLAHLKSLLEKRTPRHRKGFYMWMILAPLTAPFMIIPIIPNLPFFFCVWRSWSHYRAYKASSYLEELIQRGAIRPEENAALDKIYSEYAPSHGPTTSKEKPNNPSSEKKSSVEHAQSSPSPPPPSTSLILSRKAIPALTHLLDLPKNNAFAGEMYRALEQAQLRVDKKR